METSIDWILALGAEYERKHGKAPFEVSGWDTDADAVCLPGAIVQRAVHASAASSHKYLFVELLADCKGRYADFLHRACAVDVSCREVAVMPSVTAALFLAILVLRNYGARRFLTLTPCYFSIIETLRDLGVSASYHHLLDRERFEVNVEALKRQIETENADVLIVTDPVYTTGRDIPAEVYRSLVDMCREHGCWLLCDCGLGGFPWGSKAALEQAIALGILRTYDKTIFISSLTKKLFLNGFKTASVVAPAEIIRRMQNSCEHVIGGLTAAQAELFMAIHAPENEQALTEILTDNIGRVQGNYRLIASLLCESPYTMCRPDSGFFTMVVHKQRTIAAVDELRAVTRYLEMCDTLVLPNTRFGYGSQNRFGFRVTLYKPSESLLVPVSRCIGIEP